MEFVLVDGGVALKAAIGSLNASRALKDKLLLVLRSCFAHNCRMPSLRGAGIRGGR